MTSSERTEHYWRLQAAAQRTRMPPSRLRHYVEVGLIRPSRVEAGELLFGERELARLRKIRRLRRDLGLNSSAIEVVVRLLDELERLHTLLEQQRPASEATGSSDTATITRERATWRST